MSRCALITGASRGLGRAIVGELIRRDYTLLGICARHASGELEQVAAMARDSGVRTIMLEGNLEDPETPRHIAGRFLKESESNLDLLVNNAGFFSAGLIIDMQEQEWNTQMEVNLCAPFRLMRHSAQALQRSKGAVINISSLCGIHGAAGAAPYSAAKSGLEALTRAAAVEWGPSGVRVNAVIPGFMLETDMGQASTPAYVHTVRSLSPLDRTADVQSAAKLIAELADMPAVTGQVLTLESRVTLQDMPGFGLQ